MEPEEVTNPPLENQLTEGTQAQKQQVVEESPTKNLVPSTEVVQGELHYHSICALYHANTPLLLEAVNRESARLGKTRAEYLEDIIIDKMGWVFMRNDGWKIEEQIKVSRGQSSIDYTKFH